MCEDTPCISTCPHPVRFDILYSTLNDSHLDSKKLKENLSILYIVHIELSKHEGQLECPFTGQAWSVVID